MSHRSTFPPPSELIPGDGQLEATFRTNMGEFTIVLYEQIAPNTVSNFVGLATGQGEWIDPVSGAPGSGRFYDDVIFHRVIDGFMIQGGDRTGTGRGRPGYTFDDECHPDARHDDEGVLSMANAGRRGGRGTNGSQFFITLRATPHLDGKHTVFGKVIAGIDIVRTIGKTRTAAGDRPIQDVVIETIDVHRS